MEAFAAVKNVIEIYDMPHILVDHEAEAIPEPGMHYNLQRLVPFDSHTAERPTSQSFHKLPRQCHELRNKYSNKDPKGAISYSKCNSSSAI